MIAPPDLLPLLRKNSFRYSKSKGQHFLKDPAVAQRIVEAAGITERSFVIEIGPGTGALTRFLVTHSCPVTVVEIDDRLSGMLRNAYSNYQNLTILNQDFRHLNLSEQFREVVETGGILVSNLPYGITGLVLERMIASQNHILRAVLMLQLEVGERLTAVPGTKAYGAMTIIMAYHYRIEFLFQVSRDLFVPQPAVESVALRLTPLEKPPVSVSDVTLFKKLVKSAFQHRRKMLRHAVNRLLPGSSDLLEKQTGIDLKRRGETLNLQEFAFLSDALIDCGYSTFQSSVELQAK